MRFRGSIYKGILALLILGSINHSTAAEKRDKKPTELKPEELVWTAPPDPPRVRFKAAILEDTDFKGKTKTSFFQRLMGEKDIQEKVAPEQPYGVAVGDDGRICVADTVRRKPMVRIFRPSYPRLRLICTPRTRRSRSRQQTRSRFPCSAPADPSPT